MTVQKKIFEPGGDSRFLIFAEGKFGPRTSKTANLLLRYNEDQVCAVIDSQQAGKVVSETDPAIQSSVPIVNSIKTGLAHNPTHLVIGVAPAGGQLPDEWRDPIREAIEAGLHIVSGLHQFLSDEEEFSDLAGANNVQIVDVRKPPEITEVSQGLWRTRKIPVLLTVAPDCAMGKLTAAWELKNQFQQRNYKVGFVATGQTGILLSGEGIVVDALRGDFISAAIEQLIESEIGKSPDLIFVEGQGSIFHEGFSAVTMGILHGCMPDALLFVHRPGRSCNDYGFRFPPYRSMINAYEELIEWFRPVFTLGIQLDTSEYDQATARKMVDKVAHITGLPTTDFVRFSDGNMLSEMIHKLHLD